MNQAPCKFDAQARAQMTGWQATAKGTKGHQVEKDKVELVDDCLFEVPAGDAQATSLK